MLLGQTGKAEAAVPSETKREILHNAYMWKIINNFAPYDINFEIYENLRLGTKVLPKPIIHSTSRYQTTRDNSFVHVEPRLWNLLPCQVSDQETLPSFKVVLSTFLSQYADKPSLPGLSYINDSSLLSYPSFH